MKALTWDGAVLALQERTVPTPGSGEARVRVSLAGICNTDLEIVRGYMGFRGILGHEFVGVVEDGPPRWRGRRVVAEINFGCGQCTCCKGGLARHCAQRSVMGILGANGALAEYVVAPVSNLHEVPEGIPDEAAVFTEPLAAAFEIPEQVELRPRTEALVYGDGKLGILVALVLHEAGVDVTAIGKHPAKLGILREAGVRTLEFKDSTDLQADLVVDATGSALGLEAALRSTRPRGTIVLKSTVARPAAVDLSPLVIHEISLVGSRCGPFPKALAALAAGRIDVTRLIAEQMPLERGVEAVERASQPGTLKVLLKP